MPSTATVQLQLLQNKVSPYDYADEQVNTINSLKVGECIGYHLQGSKVQVVVCKIDTGVLRIYAKPFA